MARQHTPTTSHARPAIRELVRLLQFRASFGRPCYVKRIEHFAALIVPHLTDGPDGPYSYLRMFRRTTIDEAVFLGYVTLGDRLVDVPEFAANHWSAHPGHKGRTIALTPSSKGDAR